MVTINYDYETYDCVDIKVDVEDDTAYLLQGVRAYRAYGEDGTQNVIVNQDGTYTIDNVHKGNSTIDAYIYLNTKYSVAYYKDTEPLTGPNYQNNNIYITNEDVSSSGDAGNITGPGGMGWLNWKNDVNYQTKITLPDLPPVSADEEITGWYANGTNGTPYKDTSVAVSKVVPDSGNTIKFYAVTNKIPAPEAPTVKELNALIDVDVQCQTAHSAHDWTFRELLVGSYITSMDGNACTVTIKADPYVADLSKELDVEHENVGDASATVELVYNDGWKIAQGSSDKVTFQAKCETYPVMLVIYRNGNTSDAYDTIQLDKNLYKGQTLDLSELDIKEYYQSDFGYQFEGFYNDGGWNSYKDGNPNNTLDLSKLITINGWTNIICMVTDYEKVVVKAVVDGDKENAKDIWTGTALHGENTIQFLENNSNDMELNRTGYKLDKWYNWDWYGHKYAENTVINGWTNAYVTYTSDWQTVQVQVYRNGDTSQVYQTIKLDPVRKGEPLDLTTLKIDKFYKPDKFATGYEFEGWYNDGGWNQYIDGNPNNKLGDSITVTGWTNIICMVWDKFPVYYNLVNADGTVSAKVHTDNVTARDLASYKMYPHEDRAGYTFDGWYQTQKDFGNPSRQVGSLTMAKKWELYGTYVANSYDVIYDHNGKGSYNSQWDTKTDADISYDSTYTILDNMFAGDDLNGWVLDGWSLLPDGPVVFHPGDKVAFNNSTFPDLTEQGSITLYAIWAVDQLGGGDDGDKPDQIPDYQQVFVKYVSADPAMGSVEPSFEKFDVNGTIALTGKATASTGYAFEKWTCEDATGDPDFPVSDSEKIDFTLKTPTGGTVYTFTAHFIVSDEPEDPNAGKTLKIYWAIDNPDAASWKLFDNSSWTETIAWSDRGNTFAMPEVVVEEGYHLAGWSVSGARDEYWDADTQTFDLDGLIVEDDEGGYVSITANIVSDEPEDPNAGKTLKIYWAIDNPDAASWKLFDNSSWTETIAWSDRGNTFVMPEVVAEEGYHLAGWSVSGARGEYWDADTQTFGLDGLIVEDDEGGYVSITANIVSDEPEDPNAGKTLKIYWAIDNPDAASWKLFDNSSWTETIAWSDRGNTFVMPEVVVEEGYHLAGWSVSGARGEYWDADTQTFDLDGLIVEDDEGGYVSITANIVSDEPEDPNTGKTLKIYWAIDNPDAASWKLFDNSSWTETIAWSDRGNTFVMPEVVVEEGYHLAGWSVSGARGVYWDADTQTFDLDGLIVEDDEGGYVSITANIVKDVPATYTVTLVNEGRYAYGEGSYKAGETVTVYAGTKVGYSFDKWTSGDISITRPYSSKITFTMPAHNVVAKATWDRAGSILPSLPDVPDDTTPNWLNLDDHDAYIQGYPDGTVKPQNNITRAEVATIFFRLLTDEAREYFWSTDSGFSDVKSSDWFNNAVATMVNAGIITGYNDGTFRPNDPISRAEFATIAARFLSDPYSLQDQFYDTEGHWAEVYINRAAEVGWINGYNDGSFRPNKAITRAEAVTLVNNVLGREPHADYMLDDMITWPDNPKSAWYYEDIQEATNSHDYRWSSGKRYEIWTSLH